MGVLHFLQTGGTNANPRESGFHGAFPIRFSCYNYGVANTLGNLIGFDDFTPSDVSRAMNDAAKYMTIEAVSPSLFAST